MKHMSTRFNTAEQNREIKVRIAVWSRARLQLSRFWWQFVFARCFLQCEEDCALS
jgi:hypothetical protein